MPSKCIYYLLLDNYTGKEKKKKEIQFFSRFKASFPSKIKFEKCK